MKRFTFRLQRLLELRASAEEQRARELGAAVRDEEREREALAAGLDRLADARAQAATTPRELSQAGTLENLKLALSALAREAETLAERHQTSLARLEQERVQFEQARRDRRVLERLREQRHDTWGQELARHEQAENDEVASRRPETHGLEDG